MSEIWMQTRGGNAVDMVDPVASEVHFVEMCRSLADLNRYAGAASPAVSVAFHTLLGLEMASEEIAPYWLLHDFHETRIGEAPTPAQLAHATIAAQMAPYGFTIVRESWAELQRRHDSAIWEAAGLPPPTKIQAAEVKRIDRRALATECRDFMAEPPKAWGYVLDGIEPADTIYTWDHFGETPGMVAHRLYGALRSRLPCFLNASEERMAA